MARTKKEGLDYFPLDCVMNSKVELLEMKYGCAGFTAYIKLLQEMYRNGNAEIDLSNPLMVLSLSKRTHMKPKLWEDIVKFCTEVSLFDRKKYEKKKILFSQGVSDRLQKVEQERIGSRKRAADSAAQKTRRITAEQEEIQRSMPQSKGKETKVNETKEKESRVNESEVNEIKLKYESKGEQSKAEEIKAEDMEIESSGDGASHDDIHTQRSYTDIDTANKEEFNYLTTNVPAARGTGAKSIGQIIENMQETAGMSLEQLVAPYKKQFGDDTVKAFLRYWTEKNPGSTREKWQYKQVFDPKTRLASWKNREKADTGYKSKGEPVEPFIFGAPSPR